MGAIGFAIGMRQGGRAAPGFAFRGPALPMGASLTRASAATRIDASGTVIALGADAARFEPGGLLLEPAATNLVADSVLGGANWTLNGSAVRTTGIAAPDASDEAVRLEMPVDGSLHRFVTGLATGETYVASVWARSAGATHFRITTNNAAAWSTGVSARFALTAGWQRFAVAGLLSDGANCNLVLGAATADAGLDASCLGAIELWGAQVELGETASSLIPTAGASGSRAADLLVLDWGGKGLADGTHAVRFGFDDASSQMLDIVVADGLAAVPALARRHLKSARAR